MKQPYLERLYARIDFDRDLVFRFFTAFSLFEYALKSAGYRKTENGNAWPDWEGFAKSIEGRFDPHASAEVSGAVEYLMNQPPMQQIVEHGRLRWKERERPSGKSDIEWLTLIIRAVRNNLFHGGKFLYTRPRDTLLIGSCLAILEAWTQCDYRIQHALHRVEGPDLQG